MIQNTHKSPVVSRDRQAEIWSVMRFYQELWPDSGRSKALGLHRWFGSRMKGSQNLKWWEECKLMAEDNTPGGGKTGVRPCETARMVSVPGGAGDEEAHIVQRPPGARIRPGWCRGLQGCRRGLGLCLLWFRHALAAAHLGTHIPRKMLSGVDRPHVPTRPGQEQSRIPLLQTQWRREMTSRRPCILTPPSVASYTRGGALHTAQPNPSPNPGPRPVSHQGSSPHLPSHLAAWPVQPH